MTLLELLQLLKRHLRLVVVLPVACALVMGAYSVLFMHDTYTASTSMYVLAKGDSTTSSTSLSQDLSASQMLTNDVAKLLKSDRIVAKTGDEVGVHNLEGYKVDVQNETTSRVITLSVTGPNPQVAADVANDMVQNVSEVAQDVMSIEAVNSIDSAVAPTSPSGPRRALYVGVAALAGLFVAIAIVVVADMLNTKIRGQHDLEEIVPVPVIGRIPVTREGR
ncbi:MAG: Wzz/FepE/Etk N-terminal domain-containing protein [Olsenella sp.]|jgi:capsular polysaccharide biosynthesis protein